MKRYNRKMEKKSVTPLRKAAVAAVMLLVILPIFAQAQVGLPVLPTNILGLAFLAVLTIIAIAALVFMLSTIVDSPAARGWSRFQVYEGVLSLVLILIFLVFIYLFTLDPNGALSSIHLLPNGGEFDCSAAQDIFSIATCDVATFNRYGFGAFEAAFFTTLLIGFTPGLSVSMSFNPDLGDTSFGAGFGLLSFFPLPLDSALSFAFDAILAVEIINQVQVLILSGSLMWLAFFTSLGLIVRSFGFMRTFGGAMIALGLGLGLVYPLVTAITYGFIDVSILNSAGCLPGTIGCAFVSPSTPTGLALDLWATVVELIPTFLGSPSSSTYVPTGPWVFALGMVVAGLTFIGFLNFTIVDAFIVDFSSSIGERINFLSLLVGLI